MTKIPGLKINLEDEESADFYLNWKGIDLYMHVITVFQNKYQNEKEFNYQEISSFIRYDKSLRNRLFSYLTLLEEFLRAKLLFHKDILVVFKIKAKEIDNFKLISRQNLNSRSKLYFSLAKSQVSFGDLVKLCKNNYVLNDIESKDWNKFVKLRNQIMHHKFLLLKNYEKWTDIEKNITEIRKILKILVQYLPEAYQKGFIKSIDSLLINNKENIIFTRINLGELNYEK
ncbi:hypothetical protein [Spiroplasma attinicola]|uniref:hypothetical protein n=1 Tax=Spiroplasma attinicola TaxID=2904537 RepID=UPI002022AC6D|nr:hypothetical protein [Spiroplasma sp. JKS002670]MCL8209600.1 hypothetical protein [Spiroplasma sp. JKS002670]